MARQNESFIVTVLAGQLSAEVVPAVAVGQSRVSLRVGLGEAIQCSIYGPAVLAEVASVQVSPTDPPGIWYTVTGPVPAAGAVVTFVPPSAKAMQILLAGAAAADRVFTVIFQYDMSD